MSRQALLHCFFCLLNHRHLVSILGSLPWLVRPQSSTMTIPASGFFQRPLRATVPSRLVQGGWSASGICCHTGSTAKKHPCCNLPAADPRTPLLRQWLKPPAAATFSRACQLACRRGRPISYFTGPCKRCFLCGPRPPTTRSSRIRKSPCTIPLPSALERAWTYRSESATFTQWLHVPRARCAVAVDMANEPWWAETFSAGRATGRSPSPASGRFHLRCFEEG